MRSYQNYSKKLASKYSLACARSFPNLQSEIHIWETLGVMVTRLEILLRLLVIKKPLSFGFVIH